MSAGLRRDVPRIRDRTRSYVTLYCVTLRYVIEPGRARKSHWEKRRSKTCWEKIEETFLTVIAIGSIFCTLCHSFFMAIGDLYGVISWKQSVTDIKAAIWHTCSKHSFIIYMIGRVSITGTRYPPIAYRQSAINTSLAHKSTPKSCPNPTLTLP